MQRTWTSRYSLLMLMLVVEKICKIKRQQVEIFSYQAKTAKNLEEKRGEGAAAQIGATLHEMERKTRDDVIM